ncbi:bifunctional diguanylate cyclase/phosphodiesterase [Jannaschia ovalis]|uniref:GGDEF domain-containing phosphodiesterase n=1 Tax=Jannaschia ovalis TaxID=3038773 RepID=A0ABY8LDU8_9RHOB|nr:GGDEF domain-containing phosphodiesterase [Jannaschia sp. GRR-S6-38]WGH79496.1 GGDEF domain-containing phosphodiesterase [Jannaschia sp. GRR-S6-38]
MPGWIERLTGRTGPSAAADGPAAAAGARRRSRADPPSGAGGAIALLDVDALKTVNDDEDFDTGDRLLNAMGDVLRRALPKGAGMERLESGRFLLWLPEMALADASALADRLRRHAGAAIVDGRRGPVARTLSAGVIGSLPEETRSRALLHADMVLARAKALGGDRTETGRVPAAPSLVPAREAVEAAVARREMEYHVQPIVDLRDRRTVGVEALLRWTRGDGVALAPGQFIDTLSRIPESGSDRFAELALQAALPFVTAPTPCYCAFNISGAVLDGRGSPGCRWLSMLLEHLPPDRLVVEIVESAVIVKPDRAAELIERLRARGVRVALDDFGTGLSNLERLRQYPVDIVKIDRSFVDGVGHDGREEAILHCIGELARTLDFDVICEGIETDAQTDLLSALGIHFGQGYHLGRPAPGPDWAARLAAPD